ncbi:MAG TPA: hypothetical protein DCL73_10315, partial [Treponema sp.]|nr:hypothetical protein [Treponema sp.]
MTLSRSSLLSRLSSIEWDDFEVKPARTELPKNIWETVSAFANTTGGWIILGVEQRGTKRNADFEITGVDEPEKLEQDFTTALRSDGKFNVPVVVDCSKYDFDGKTVLGFYIHLSEHKPVYFNSLQNTFVRSGSGDQRANEYEINAMYRDQAFGTMSAKPVPGTSAADLNTATYQRYRRYLSEYNNPLPYNKMSDDDFNRKLEIVKDGQLTYGGLLMFGNQQAIIDRFSDFHLDFLEIPGNSYAEAKTRYTYRIDEQENLWEYYFVMMQRLRIYVNSSYHIDTMGFGHEESPELEALREALVNMLMHADYFSPMKSRIRVFNNRIEFENPGNFPRPVEELLQVDITIPRNPVIARLFRCTKLCENAGYGFDKMLSWKKLTGYDVDFENRTDACKTIFWRTEKTGTENADVIDTTQKTTQ